MPQPEVTHMRGRQAGLFLSMLLATLPEDAWEAGAAELSSGAHAVLDSTPDPEDWVSLRVLAELADWHHRVGGPETSRVRGSLMAEILHGDLPEGMTPLGFLQAMPWIFSQSFQGGAMEVAVDPEGRADITLHGAFPLPGLVDKAIPSCIFTSLKQAGALSVVVDLLPPETPDQPTRYRVRWFEG